MRCAWPAMPTSEKIIDMPRLPYDNFIKHMGIGTYRLLPTIIVALAASESWANYPPVVSSLAAQSYEVVMGQSTVLSAQVTDPDGDPLNFLWSASGGSIAGSGITATWTAPLRGGTCGMTLTVTDSGGLSATRSLTLQSVPALYLFSIPTPGRPARVAADTKGNIYTTVPDRGEVEIFDQSGILRGTIQDLFRPLGIAVGNGRIYVGDQGFHEVRVFDMDGTYLQSLGSGRDQVSKPSALAVDPASGRIYVSDGEEGLIKVFSPGTGDFLFSFGRTANGDARLQYPSGIAINQAQGKIMVADFDASSIKAYDLTGGGFSWLMGPYTAPMYVEMSFGGPVPPQPSLTDSVPARLEGLAMNSRGWFFGTETTLSVVEVFDAGGNFLAILGGEGNGPEQLKTPTDVAVDSQNRLVVADSGNSRVQVYGLAGYVARHPEVLPPPQEPPPVVLRGPGGQGGGGLTGRGIGCSCSLGGGSDDFLNALQWAVFVLFLAALKRRRAP